jgi:hypothetical protein
MSPFRGQLSGKLLFASTLAFVVPGPEHKGSPRFQFAAKGDEGRRALD